jgi:hypothetical protein
LILDEFSRKFADLCAPSLIPDAPESGFPELLAFLLQYQETLPLLTPAHCPDGPCLPADALVSYMNSRTLFAVVGARILTALSHASPSFFAAVVDADAAATMCRSLLLHFSEFCPLGTSDPVPDEFLAFLHGVQGISAHPVCKTVIVANPVVCRAFFQLLIPLIDHPTTSIAYAALATVNNLSSLADSLPMLFLCHICPIIATRLRTTAPDSPFAQLLLGVALNMSSLDAARDTFRDELDVLPLFVQFLASASTEIQGAAIAATVSLLDLDSENFPLIAGMLSSLCALGAVTSSLADIADQDPDLT